VCVFVRVSEFKPVNHVDEKSLRKGFRADFSWLSTEYTRPCRFEFACSMLRAGLTFTSSSNGWARFVPHFVRSLASHLLAVSSTWLALSWS